MATRRPQPSGPGHDGAAGGQGRGALDGRRAVGGARPAPPDPWSAPDAPLHIDVDLLADQVVRRIDDRIIAHRERLGRI